MLLCQVRILLYFHHWFMLNCHANLQPAGVVPRAQPIQPVPNQGTTLSILLLPSTSLLAQFLLGKQR